MINTKETIQARINWVFALRSGFFRWIKYELADGKGGYCARGILAGMVGYDKACHQSSDERNKIERILWEEEKKLGFSMLDRGLVSKIIYLNNTQDLSTVANWIEDNLIKPYLDLLEGESNVKQTVNA